MLVFGLLTIRNLGHAQRVGTSTADANNVNATSRQNRRDEASLTAMLIVQVILLTIFTLLPAGQKFYLTHSFYHSKSVSQRALKSLIFNFVLLRTYIPRCITFYSYTITGTLFQQKLFFMFQTGFT